jgi:hypothetical protein
MIGEGANGIEASVLTQSYGSLWCVKGQLTPVIGDTWRLEYPMPDVVSEDISVFVVLYWTIFCKPCAMFCATAADDESKST